MQVQAQAAAGVRWTSVSSAAVALCDVTRAVILARFLSPGDFGLMSLAAIAVGFAQMYMDLGIGAAVIHRQDTTRDQLSSLYWLNLLFGAALFGCVSLAAPLVPALFQEPRVLPLLRTMAFVFLIAPWGSQFEVLLQKELSFRKLAQCEIAASLGATFTAISCAAYGLGAWSLVWGFLAAALLKTTLLVVIGIPKFRPTLRFRRTDIAGFLGFGAFQMGERSINYLAERLDQVLIGALLGTQALGLYSFALYLTAQPIARINPILTRVAFPLFARLQQDTERLKRAYMRLIGLVAMVNAPLLIGLAAVAPVAVPLIFGDKWLPAVPLVQILSVVSLSRSIGNPVGSLQLAKGRADLGFLWNVLLLVCSVPAIYAGSRVAGVSGVALSLLLLHVFANAGAYALLIRPLIGACARSYSYAALRPVTVAILMGAAVGLLPWAYRGAPAGGMLATQILVGACLYAILSRLINRAAFVELRSVLVPG